MEKESLQPRLTAKTCKQKYSWAHSKQATESVRRYKVFCTMTIMIDHRNGFLFSMTFIVRLGISLQDCNTQATHTLTPHQELNLSTGLRLGMNPWPKDSPQPHVSLKAVSVVVGGAAFFQAFSLLKTPRATVVVLSHMAIQSYRNTAEDSGGRCEGVSALLLHHTHAHVKPRPIHSQTKKKKSFFDREQHFSTSSLCLSPFLFGLEHLCPVYLSMQA